MRRASGDRDRRRRWRGSEVPTTALVVSLLGVGAGFAALVYTANRFVDALPELGSFDFDLDFDLGLPGADQPTSYAPKAMHGSTPRWIASGASPFASAPVVADGRVFIREQDGGLSAHDVRTGARLWTAAVGGAPLSVEFAPVVADGTVYAVGGDVLTTGGAGASAAVDSAADPPDPPEVPVVALDAATGAVRWTAPVGGLGGHPVRVADGDLYVNAASLLALDRATGAVRWSAEVGNGARGGYSTPAVLGDVVAVGGGDGSVHAFDRATGSPRWAVPVAVASTPAIGGAGAAVAATQDAFVVVSPDHEPDLIGDAWGPGRIRALDPTTGAERWSHPLAGVPGIGAAPTVDGPTVYAATASVDAFDAATGERRWRAPVTSAAAFSFTPLTVFDGVVFVPGAGGRLHGLDARTGAGRATFGAPPPRVRGDVTPFPPAFAGDTVVLPSAASRLYAYPAAVLTAPPPPEAPPGRSTSAGP